MEEPRNEQGQTLQEFLAAYDETKYRRPSVTADIVVFTMLYTGEIPAPPCAGEYSLGVLLIRRKNHPFIGTWALPGGFVNMDEDLSAAAARELEEETGLSGLALRQFGAFGAPQRDPRTRIVTAGYYGIAPFGSLSPKAGDDAADAALFSVSLKLRAQCPSAEAYRIGLQAGPVSLWTQAKRIFDAMGPQAAYLPGGDLASDHGLLLFQALCALEAQPRTRVANLLSGGSRPLFHRANKLLEDLFADFH